jgi:hypothetical protein
MNESMDWWVELLAAKTAAARAHAAREFRSAEKQQIFMDAFHWAMLEVRPEIFQQRGE